MHQPVLIFSSRSAESKKSFFLSGVFKANISSTERSRTDEVVIFRIYFPSIRYNCIFIPIFNYFFPFFDISPLNAFVEIDYGVDENKTEEEVRLRLGNGNIEKGKKIIEDWDKNAVV